MEQRNNSEALARDFSRWATRPNRAATFDRSDPSSGSSSSRNQSADSADVLRGRLRSETTDARSNWKSAAGRSSARTVADSIKIGARRSKDNQNKPRGRESK